MVADALCARCGEALPPDATRCPACGSPTGLTDPAPESTPPSAAAMRAANEAVGDLPRRVTRLGQWNEAARPLGVSLPLLPSWAEEATRTADDPEVWGEVVRGIERLAQQKVTASLEEWERRTKNRLARLEAYSVDGRLERDQIEDVLHAARAGEVSQALSTYVQVDRVVALKERHLDQAREDLERLVSLLRDMRALGLPTTQDPSELSDDLERELRSGRLASLKQQLRALRLQAVTRLKVGLPAYVTQYGELLLRERSEGLAVDLESAELARGAKEFVEGKPEESLRRLRLLQQMHGSGHARPTRPRSGGAATEASRTA